MSFHCHKAADDPRVTVSNGLSIIFSLDTYVIVSIPTTPGRVARQQAAAIAKQRRAVKKSRMSLSGESDRTSIALGSRVTEGVYSDVEAYYSARVAKYGATPLGVDWSCQATQSLALFSF